ncbi:hypothetical protein JCM10914_2996 [Paenibacillus sp. JCM 10914]|nr:hypothetical protein JCM10914_2996 [Paenibacillus sp. JCM 10914]
MMDEHQQLPMIEGVSWNKLTSTHGDVLDMLRDACTQLTDADLSSVVVFGHDQEKEATIRWGLWHIADHCRYHQAHINQLRKWYGLRAGVIDPSSLS